MTAKKLKIKLNKLKGKGRLGYGSDFWLRTSSSFAYNAFALVVAAELVDLGFDDLHVAFVVEVFLVFVHVNG